MADKKVNLIISLKDGVSSGLSRISSGFKSVGEAAQRLYFTSKVVAEGIKTAFQAITVPILKAFDFETAKVQLKSLLGSVELAGKRFDELKKFSAETPFQLPDILKASRTLTVFTEGAMGSAKSMKNIGDAAAVANVPISEVSFWVGRAYSMLKGGQPFGEAAMRLQEMGVLTSSTRQKMEEMQKSGASFSSVWQVLNGDLGRFSGGMEDLSRTGNGLISTLKDNWTIALAKFGDTFMELSKGAITDAINIIQKLTNDGTITRWAEQAKAGLQAVVDTVKILTKGGDGQKEVMHGIANVIKAAFIDAGTALVNIVIKAAPIIGGLIGDAFKATAVSVIKETAQKSQIRGQLYKEGKLLEEKDSAFWDSPEKKAEARSILEHNQALIDGVYANRIAEERDKATAEAVKKLGDNASNTEVAFTELQAAINKYKTEATRTTSNYSHGGGRTDFGGEMIGASAGKNLLSNGLGGDGNKPLPVGGGSVGEYMGVIGTPIKELIRLLGRSDFVGSKKELLTNAKNSAKAELDRLEKNKDKGRFDTGYFAATTSGYRSKREADEYERRTDYKRYISQIDMLSSGKFDASVLSGQADNLTSLIKTNQDQLGYLKTISERVGGIQ